MKTFILTILLFCASFGMKAARVDTLQVESPSMKKRIEVIVISPDLAEQKPCPVVYLLHGHGGNARTWLGIKPELPEIADEKGFIFVCPYGENSWYWDSPLNKDVRFETFISSELVAFIDANYRTIADRKGRAITGLSMGGHGARPQRASHHRPKYGRTRGYVECYPPFRCIFSCRKYEWGRGYPSFSKELEHE